MENREAALLAINHRAVYDISLNRYVYVNKLIYWGDELMILGYTAQYKASEYGKSWRLAEDGELEKYAIYKKFEEWLDETKKLQKRNKNGED